MKTVFVTGGTGFVGQNLIPMLIENGYTVKALARSNWAVLKIQQLGAIPVEGDLSDSSALGFGVAGCSSVFHLAASVDFFASEKDLKGVHVDATEILIKLSKEGGVKKFIYLGAASVIMNGRPISNANETFVSNCITDGYSKTKLQAENIVVKSGTQDFQTISLRPPLIWGKGDPNTLPAIVEAARKGRLPFIGGGKHRFVTCHVLNVCHALILADKSQCTGEVYFLTDGETPVFKEFIKQYVATQGVNAGNMAVSLRIARMLAAFMEIVWKIFYLKGHPPLYKGLVNTLGLEFTTDDSKARRELGYQTLITIQQGLELMKKL